MSEFMDLRQYTISSFNKKGYQSVSTALKELKTRKDLPVICCIGSDIVLGDSLGPLVGTMLKRKNINSYVYGTLEYPITAKEIDYIVTHLKKTHPNSEIIAIDAAVGNEDDVGLIKIANVGLKPGLGVNKKLKSVGTKSIIGIVAEKSLRNFNLFNATRLNLVYRMAEHIANGIVEYCNEIENHKENTEDFAI